LVVGMEEHTESRTDPTERTLVITREFDAPRALVFRAWIDPRHVVEWWGPEGFVITSCTMDVRPGGAWRICMRAPDGAEHWHGGVFREVVPPERLVFTHAWDEADGMPGHETLITVTFAERGQRTLLTFEQAVFESVSARDGHHGGWSECFDHLAEHLARS
jgi:uncharacterized protein YndB with AHSA1/START domain